MTYEIESKVNVSNDGSNYNDNEKDNVNLDEKDKIGYEVNRETDEVVDVNYKGMEIPTEDEMINLRKVADTVPFHVFIIVLVEFAERFSYYSCSGPFQNYIENKLPNGSTTGASVNDGTPGVMGLGQQTSTGLNQFFSFFCYITPILGSIIADVKLGRFRTICVFTVVYLLGLIILTLTSIPQAISTVDNGTNSAPFAGLVVAIILIGLGAGGIKSNISILLCDQIKSDVPYIKVTKQGERVVVDPNLTVSKLMAAFYFTINVGSLASLCSTTSERKIGFWLAYALPTIVFCTIPFLLLILRKKLNRIPPRGSVLIETIRVIRIVLNNVFSFNPIKWYKNVKANKSYWNIAKPSYYVKVHNQLPAFVTWDDAFVDEVKRTLRACRVFIFFPFYWIVYNQNSNNLVSLAGSLTLGDTPNDLIQVIDPIFIIAAIPILDILVYPLLSKCGIQFKSIARISFGFFFASLSMIYTAVIQWYTYRISPCHEFATSCDEPAPINVWIVAPAYALIALSECFASITGLSFAIQKSPANMKGLVMAIYLIQTAFGNAINMALLPVSKDPSLVWMYTGIAVTAFVFGCIFYICFYKWDRLEELDNAIGRGNRDPNI